MNQIKLVLSSLALVVLAACGGKSDSDSTDTEFFKASSELRQTLPQVNESLSSQSPEGIWRVASQSIQRASHAVYNEDIQESSGILNVSIESSSQLLIIIKKDHSAENTYIVYRCDGYRGAKSWALGGNTLSYGNINDDIFSPEDEGSLVLNNNLRLFGQSSYEYHDSNSDETKNTTYAGVKVSDAINFQEAQNLNVDLKINIKDSVYLLSDDLINPNCFSIRQSVGRLEIYTPSSDSSETYNQSSSSFVIEMRDGNRIGADKITTVIDSDTSVDDSGYYSEIDKQDFQLYYCSEESESPDDECLKSFDMTTSAEINAMSAASKGESLSGETFDVTFSYRQEYD